MITKLTILRGPAASGKSTYVAELRKKNSEIAVVSRDAIRFAIFGKYWGVDEELISKVEKSLIRHALTMGKHVVSDNTNVQAKFTNALVDIAYQLGVEVELVNHFKNVPLEECLKRNDNRERQVPEDVLIDQWNRSQKKYELPPVPALIEKYVPDTSLPTAILVDLDGTAAIHNGRTPYEEHKCDTDLPNEAVREICEAMFHHGPEVVYVSARQEKSRNMTSDWLNRHGFPPGPLYMRETGDMRKDWVVKNEIFEATLKHKYNVLLCIDDRDVVVDMYRRKGIDVMQCNYGSF